MTFQRVFSGVRPTGEIHLGNYLGAIRNWVAMQNLAQENIFCIVDLHSLTTIEETSHLADHTLMTAAAYLAAGIDPSKSIIFAQSHVPAVTHLAWIFGCLTPLGWLNRMTQFKEKAGKHKELSCLGLYAYPVLMAADILLYKATHVPVGEDQKQHLELARDIAGTFNRRFEKEVFPLPEPMIQGLGTRVMSLRDGRTKMSKSDPSDYSRILLMDDPDTIQLKIRKAKTDMEPIPATIDMLSDRPEALNLINIYAALSNQSANDVCAWFEGSQFAPFKKELADLLIDTITPMGNRMRELLEDRGSLITLLKSGAQHAKTLANKHISEISKAIGMLEG